MVLYRYTEWDGSQELPELGADEVLEGLTDDLMNFGDLQHALRNMLSRGMRGPQQNRMQGLRDLLQQLRQQKRAQLDKYNLNSVFDDFKRQLNEILQRERETLDRRSQEAANALQNGQPRDGQNGESGEQDGTPQGEAGDEGMAEGRDRSDGQPGDDGAEGMEGQQGQQGQQGQSGMQQRGMRGQRGQQGGMSQQGMRGQQQSGSQQGQQGGQQGQQSQQDGSQPGGGQDQFAEMLRNITNRKKDFLDKLPTDLGGAMK